MTSDEEKIIEKYLSNEALSQEEQKTLHKWMQDEGKRRRFVEFQRIRSAIYALGVDKLIDTEKSWDKLNQQLGAHKRNLRFLPYAAAAIMVIGLGISWGVLTHRHERNTPTLPISQQVVPGQKQAILTLSTGQQVVLSDSLSPMLEKNGTTIHNTGCQLVYNPTDTSQIQVYNTVTVPRGGEYKLVLSDGSIIWVNSESEITYPVTFSANKREITLKGEAFFEIQKDSKRPFIVKTNQFDIRVTGTQFNVRSYPQDVPSATLTEGSIQLEQSNHITHLVPGQQASLINGEIQIQKVDLEEAVAWRYEAFCFKQRPLESLLNEIARWYDIEIFYQNNEVRNYHFTAWFRRSTPIQELINILEKTEQIKLELKGKTLTVRTYHNS